MKVAVEKQYDAEIEGENITIQHLEMGLQDMLHGTPDGRAWGNVLAEGVLSEVEVLTSTSHINDEMRRVSSAIAIYPSALNPL